MAEKQEPSNTPKKESPEYLNGSGPKRKPDWYQTGSDSDPDRAVNDTHGPDGSAAKGARRGRPRKTGDEKNDNYQTIVEAIARALIGETSLEDGRPLDGLGLEGSNILIRHTLDKDGGMEYLAIDASKTVLMLSERRLNAIIAEFVKSKVSNHAAWIRMVGRKATAKDIKAIADHLYLIAPTMPDTIVSYAPVGYEGFAFNRAKIDMESLAIERPKHKRQYPTIKEKFLDRISNNRALMAFIGSLFFPESDRSQYLYIYGEGGTGKDRLGHMIFDFFHGTNACIKGQVSSLTKDDKHFTHSIRGTRLCIFGECDDFNIPNSPLFKDITGSNRLTIRPMYKTPYTAYVDTKFIFLSNTKPNTERQIAAARRIIYCEIAPFEGDAISVGVLDKMLAKERDDFLLDCIEEYKLAMVQNGVLYHGVIGTDKEALNDIADTYSAEITEWFDKHFAVGEHLYVLGTEKINQLASELAMIGVRPLGVKKFLQERHGAKYSLRKIKGHPYKVWNGIGIKNSLEALKKPDSFNGDSKAWGEYLAAKKSGREENQGEMF